MGRKEGMSEDEARVYAMHLAVSTVLPMVLRSTVDLGILDVIAKAGPEARLSAAEILSRLPTPAQGEDFSSMIDRILYSLASFSIVTCSIADEGGAKTRAYGLTPAGRFFLSDGKDSLAPMLGLNCSPVVLESFRYLKGSILEGGVPFEKAHGISAFEYTQKIDPNLGHMFNEAMAGMTNVSMNKLIDAYKGFEDVGVLVDVAGGVGALLKAIVSNYPKIKGINFDQPHVIGCAPSYEDEGIQHVRGDMFKEVPRGDAIMLRCTLHDWDDESCVKILKTCNNALEDGGKIIIIDCVLPPVAETTSSSKYATQLDMLMMNVHGGGKERTEDEFRAIARAAGFIKFEVACSFSANSIIELKK